LAKYLEQHSLKKESLFLIEREHVLDLFVVRYRQRI